VSDLITEKNKIKQLFSNPTSRTLMGIWVLLKGSQFSLKAVSELLSVSEDGLDAKFQTFSGLGLIHVSADFQGERQVEFLGGSNPDLERSIVEFFEGRKNDFEMVELKVRSLIYKTILTTLV
jgi:hypothetical protein